MSAVATAAGLLLFALPLAVSLGLSLGETLGSEGWRTLWAQPQTFRAWGLSLGVATASSLLTLLLVRAIATRAFLRPLWEATAARLPALLSLPHAAFAVGLAFLIAPSGWLFRLVSPWLTGWAFPPDWPTVQDPWGLALTAGLVLKEVPFLLWMLLSVLDREEVRVQLLTAETLGYGRDLAWARVVWPQVFPRLRLPLLAVFCYSLTVVDMALILGPTHPPTLAVMAWQALLEPDGLHRAEAVATTGLLTVTALVIPGLAWGFWRASLSWRRKRWCLGRGDRSGPLSGLAVPSLVTGGLVYGFVLGLLGLWSVAGLWVFPSILPDGFSIRAWRSVAESLGTVRNSLGLASATSGGALLLAIAWLEWSPWARRRVSNLVLFAPLVLPGLLLVVGLHRLLLLAALDGSFPGLMIAHGVLVVPYVVIALAPAYLAFDPRLATAAHTLGHGELSFLWRVKWPLLAGPIASAFAVGFAVSVAQYLPTQFIGAGRFPTVTTEAVTLASGGQRSLTAAYALLQMALPMLVFALARRFGPRRDPCSN